MISCTFIPFVYSTIVYWMSNLNPQITSYMWFCAIIVMAAQCGAAFGDNKLNIFCLN